MGEPIRILNVVGKMNMGGAESLIMNIYRKIDRTKIQFDFMVHCEEKCVFDDEITALGGRIYHIPQYNVKNHFEYKKKWERFFKEHPEYKILHAHMTGSAAVFIPIAKKYGCFAIAHSHTAGAKGGLRQSVINLYQLPLRYMADYMLACSESAALWTFGKKALKKSNIKVLQNGIDLERFSENAEKKSEAIKEFNLADKFVMTYVARLHPMKNHSFLLDIFKEVLRQEENARLIIVGSGTERENIENKAKNLGIDDKVIMTGARNDTDKILCVTDVFCMTSLFEGFPVSLIEAQACGIKCICPNHITKTVNITNSVTMLDLNYSAKVWADECLKYKNGEKIKNAKQMVKSSGFDINDTAEWLEKFYLSNKNGR